MFTLSLIFIYTSLTHHGTVCIHVIIAYNFQNTLADQRINLHHLHHNEQLQENEFYIQRVAGWLGEQQILQFS